MADSKITALTSISTSSDPANDPLVIVDVSDTSMAATGTTKKVTLNQLLATSPTATLASATISGDLTVDTSTLKVDSANNRVGIGLTSPNRNLSIYGASNSLIHFTTATTGPLNTDGFTFGVETDSSVALFNSENTPFNFYVNSTLGMTLNSTGLGVGVVPSAGRGAIQLSAGVGFPATQVASTDANTLDDYKEGTFTATLNSGTFTSQVFKYTKIGNLVTVFFDFIVGTGGGDRVTNLPYTAAGTVANGIYTNAQTYAAGTTAPTAVVGGSSTVLFFRTVGTGVAFSAMTLTGGAAITGSISYFV